MSGQKQPKKSPNQLANQLVDTHRFRGRFETKLDPKGRVSLPSSYRFPSSSLMITNSRFRSRSCLDIYTFAEWAKLERQIAELSPLVSDVQSFSRFYLSGAQQVDIDAQGRFLIPQSLRKFAGFDQEIMLVGLGAKFEVWAKSEWDVIYAELTSTFEDTLSRVADAVSSTVSGARSGSSRKDGNGHD